MESQSGRTHQDQAITGFDTREALGGLAKLTASLEGVRALVEAETADVHRQAQAFAPVKSGRYRSDRKSVV